MIRDSTCDNFHCNPSLKVTGHCFDMLLLLHMVSHIEHIRN